MHSLNLDLVEYLGYITSHLELVKNYFAHAHTPGVTFPTQQLLVVDRALGNHFTSNATAKTNQLPYLQTRKGNIEKVLWLRVSQRK